jgi:hypothetical protein
MPEQSAGRPARPRRRAAWIYYALITAGAIVGGFTNPDMFALAPLTALYARYLYRGGRFVIWFW